MVAAPVGPIFDALAGVAEPVDVGALQASEHKMIVEALGDQKRHPDRTGGRVLGEPPSQGAAEGIYRVDRLPGQGGGDHGGNRLGYVKASIGGFPDEHSGSRPHVVVE